MKTVSEQGKNQNFKKFLPTKMLLLSVDDADLGDSLDERKVPSRNASSEKKRKPNESTEKQKVPFSRNNQANNHESTADQPVSSQANSVIDKNSEEFEEKRDPIQVEPPFKGRNIDYEVISNHSIRKDSENVSYHEVQDINSIDPKPKKTNIMSSDDSEESDDEANETDEKADKSPKSSSSSELVPPAPLAPKNKSNGGPKRFIFNPQMNYQNTSKLLITDSSALNKNPSTPFNNARQRFSPSASGSVELARKIETMTKEYERKVSDMSEEMLAKEEKMKMLETTIDRITKETSEEIAYLKRRNEKLRIKKNEYKRLLQENQQSIDFQM